MSLSDFLSALGGGFGLLVSNFTATVAVVTLFVVGILLVMAGLCASESALWRVTALMSGAETDGQRRKRLKRERDNQIVIFHFDTGYKDSKGKWHTETVVEDKDGFTWVEQGEDKAVTRFIRHSDLK